MKQWRREISWKRLDTEGDIRMNRALQLTVLTPAEALLHADEVEWVQVPLADGGGIGVFPGHAPLVAETITGPVRYADDAGEHTVEVSAGILQIDSEGVTILTGGFAYAQSGSYHERGPRFDRLAQTVATLLENESEGIWGADEVER